MECPSCKKELEAATLLNTDVDYCSSCSGLWFDKDELNQVKDKRDPEVNWLDIDLWKYEAKFEISKTGRLCPCCRMPLYEVRYDNSRVRIDLCNLCCGIWLDQGEFKKIIAYLKDKADYEVMYNFSKNLAREFGEIFVGPESMRKEILDFLTLLKLLGYKFSIRHPFVARMINVGFPK